MSLEPFVSRAKALPAKRNEKGYGDENDGAIDGAVFSVSSPGVPPLLERGARKIVDLHRYT